MNNRIRAVARGMAAAALVALAGCAQTGGLGNVLGGVLGQPAPGSTNQLSAEIDHVDTGSRAIYVRTSDGQLAAVGYDNNTQVRYQNQTYPVTALQQGDQVLLYLQNTGNGYYTNDVEVQQTVQERNGTGGTYGNANVQTVQGSVTRIDAQNGAFWMREQNGTTVEVTLPYNPRTSDVNRFRSLRVGDYVQIQGQWVNQSRLELMQFL